MAVGYRNSAGMDFDNLFDPGSTGAPGFRKTDGTDLRYAARGSIPKIPDVGFRDAFGSDLSNLWAPRSFAPPMPGFNGQTYNCSAQAPTNQTGQTGATLLLLMRATGVWEVLATKTGTSDSGTVTLDSGVWLPSGNTGAQFTVQFSVNGGTGQGVVSNSAPTPAVLSANQSVQLYAEVPAASSQLRTDSRVVTTTLTRIGSDGVIASTTLNVEAAGWF